MTDVVSPQGRCSVAGGPAIAGEYTVRITTDGAFRIENSDGGAMSGGCCIDIFRD